MHGDLQLTRCRSETNFGDFESIWNGIQQETNATRDMLAEEEAYKHFGDEADAWQNFDSAQGFDGLRTHDQFSGELGHYLFEENNLFKDVPNAYEEGMKIVREGGNLSLAALAFEAAVQRDENFVEAWVALGQAQAQNEKESPAIRALEQALKLDPDNLEALMGLAVSYTNESFDSLAYRSLERWVSVRYPQLGVTPRGLDDSSEDHISFTGRAQLQERVTDLFLEAAQLNPEGTGVDVDVQVGLGVLFYGSEDYDKAANSGRSEEAIEAYSRALEINSNFVRARYNLGVSCINLGVNEQAASHLLGALSMHRVIETEGRQKAAELLSDGNGNAVDDSVVEGLLAQNQSTNLYDTLRRTFMSMNRRDLSDRVGPDMDLDALRGEFDF
jgi:peroxin-5